LAPSDLAGLATFGQSGMRVLVEPTAERERLGRAIDSLELGHTQQLKTADALAREMGASDSEGSGMDSFLREQAAMLAREQARQYRRRVHDYIVSLEGLGAGVDGFSGRTHVILLSAGFEPWVLFGSREARAESAAENVTPGLPDPEREFGDAPLQREVDRLYTALRSADTVIHSVDLGGLGAATGPPDVSSPADATVHPFDRGHETLAPFALNTGGRFVADRNDLGAVLGEIVDATRRYYVLAFEPADAGKRSGQLRKLEVRSTRAGLVVSHRAAYVSPGPERVEEPAPRQAGRPGAETPLLQPTTEASASPASSAPVAAERGEVGDDVERLLRRAGQSVTALVERLAVLVAREEYTQTVVVVGPRREDSDSWLNPTERALVSEVAWVAGDGEGSLVFFRDVLSVDGQRVGDRADRLEKLFSGGATVAAREQGARIRAEGARYNLGPLRTVNDPAVALWFLHPRNQSRFRFRARGPGKPEGVDAQRIDFTEVGRPTLVQTSQGVDLPARGALWIEPEGASLVFSQLELHVPGFGTTQIRVTYRRQPGVDAWLPAVMREVYRTSAGRLEGLAEYSHFRQAQVEVQEIRPVP
jgi:VWFA-related protein